MHTVPTSALKGSVTGDAKVPARESRTTVHLFLLSPPCLYQPVKGTRLVGIKQSGLEGYHGEECGEGSWSNKQWECACV